MHTMAKQMLAEISCKQKHQQQETLTMQATTS